MLSTALLVNEAFLGALLVKLGYVTGNQSTGRVLVLSIHLSNTLLLLAALTLTAKLLGTAQMWSELGVGGAKRLWAFMGLASTLVVGVSGSLAALGDTLFPASSLRAAFVQDFAADSPWLLRLRGVHPVSAVVAAVFVFWLVGQARRAGAGRLAGLVLGLLGFQFALGLADVLLLAPVWMQILHLLGADLYWVALVTLAAGVVWPNAGATLPNRPIRRGLQTSSLWCAPEAWSLGGKLPRLLRIGFAKRSCRRHFWFLLRCPSLPPSYRGQRLCPRSWFR